MRSLRINGLATLITIAAYYEYGMKCDLFAAADWIVFALASFAYVAYIWLRGHIRSFRPYLGISALIIACAIFLHMRHPLPDLVYGRNLALVLLWPLVWILATVPLRYVKQASAVAVLILAAVYYINRNASSPFDQLLAPLGIYLGVRGFASLRESSRVSKRHLSELHEAHARLQRAHEDLQEAGMQSLRYAALSERTRLARDIHDGIGHQLTSLIVQMQALEIMLPAQAERAAEQVPIMLETARKAMSEVRSAVREWSDDETGLGIAALKGLAGQSAAQSGIEFRFECDERKMPELPLDTGVILYRVLQETLTNVMKHSGANRAVIRLEAVEGRAVLSVSDNGVYSSHAELKPDFGMLGMRSRCEEAGGTLTWAANEPRGLIVRAELPLNLREMTG